MLYLYIYTSILVLDQINGTLTIYTNTTQYNASLLYQINALYLVHYYMILILGRRGQQTYKGIILCHKLRFTIEYHFAKSES